MRLGRQDKNYLLTTFKFKENIQMPVNIFGFKLVERLSN